MIDRLLKQFTLLGLLAPFLAYAGYAVVGGLREMAPGAAAERPAHGPPPPAVERAAAAAEELRAAAGKAVRYAADGPAPSKAVTGLDDAAVARGQVLSNALALQSGDSPKFVGPSQGFFEALGRSRGRSRADEERIHQWFRGRTPAASPAEARGELAKLRDLLREYQGNDLHDPRFAADRELEGVFLTADELARLAEPGYLTAWQREAAPLDPGDKVRDQVTAVLDQFAEYDKLFRRFSREGLSAGASRVAEAAARADEWKTRRDLLQLFRGDPVQVEANQIAAHLKNVQTAHNRLKSEPVRELVRKQVQRFCGRAVPVAVALDAEVLVGDERCKRADVELRYETAGKVVERPLSADPGGLTEFNFRTAGPAGSPQAYQTGVGLKPADLLTPTPASKAAQAYFVARGRLAGWTAAEVDGLVAAGRAAGADLLNARPGLTSAGKPADEPARVLDRLAQVRAAMDDCPELFR